MPAQNRDWWANDQLSPVNDPDFTGVIPGAPKPKDPKSPVFVPQGATRVFDPNTNTYSEVPPADDTKTPAEQEALRNEALGKVGLAASLIRRSRDGWFTTGFGAGIVGKIGGTEANDVAADTETLKAAGALSRIMEMSRATGKNLLTPISNADFEALSRSIANLDTSQSDENYQRNVQRIIDIYRNAYKSAGGDPADIDKLVEQEIGESRAPDAQGPAPGVGELNDEQKKAYAAFVGANPEPTADQLRAFFDSIGVHNVVNAEDISQGIRKRGRYSTATLRGDIRRKTEEKAQEFLGKARGRTAAAAAGFLDTTSAGFGDEITGALNAFKGSMAGEGSFSDLYAINKGAANIADETLREEHPYLFTGGQIGGAFLLPTGKISTVRQGIKQGAGYGALYGFGSNEGTDRLSGAAVGGAAGGVVGGTISALAPFVAKRLPMRLGGAQRGMAPDVAEAAAAENVDLVRPMVDPSTISEYGALESNVYSQPIIRGAAGRVRGQIEDRVGQLAPGGAALEQEAAGELVQGAGRRFIQRSKGVADRLYNRARNLAGDKRFTPEKALEQVDSELAQLQSNPETNAGEIAFLEGLKRDLSSPDGKTVEELRQLRTSLRGRINEQSLGATQAEARAIRAMDATQTDVAANVPAAASAYRRADTFYRERQTHIDDIIERITGGKVGQTSFQVSSDKAFARLKAMASPGGDGRRLAALMRDLEPSERQDIAATIAQSLGRRSEDEPFSTALFLSQTRKLSPSARRTIFGPDGAQSIDNLRLLSRRLEEAEKDINRSRSATVLERQGWRMAARNVISTLAGLGGAGAMGAGHTGVGLAGFGVAAAAMGGTAARKVLSARAMVNPRVSRWLGEAADVSTPEQAAQSVRKLGVIISREPALAHELQPIQDMLSQRIAQPLAAESGDQDEQR